jgi:hypothetical protein
VASPGVGRPDEVAPNGNEEDGPTMPPRHRLLNAREAIGYLGISLNTLNRIEKRGLLRPFRTPGGHRRYDQSMLDDYLERSRRARGRRAGR